MILTAVGATRLVAQGASDGDAVGVLASSDALYIAASISLFPYAPEE